MIERIKRIKRFFADNLQPGPQAQEPPLHLAAAALMVEVSRADYVFDDVERQAMVRVLRDQFSLDRGTVDQLIELAEAEVEASVSLYQFTQLVNAHYDPDKKRRLIGAMWQVVYADGRLDKYEDHLIRKVAELIHVSHSDFIRLKLEAAK
ncbi:TerB family tellurite resistance protein [Motiliproteus sp. SC1-56]|uniref:tellurite resistance TerB family protein n=1 Tax=Motiliproteus sp. SC1-56 TaxID=2799565 RepID=UPI001A8C2DEC|nr:TerB family tellurite resistance protein [Motiliproteus sp. SC1-56]